MTPGPRGPARPGLLVCAALLVLGAACDLSLQRASLANLAVAEEEWQAHSVPDYRLVAEVVRPNERRRVEVVVRGGTFRAGSQSYWEPQERRWLPPTPLRAEQADPFTPPGLCRTLREELERGNRSDVRFSVSGDPPFPRRILLGAEKEKGKLVPGSEALIAVKSFEPLPPEK